MTKKYIIISLLVLIGSFISVNFALAESCPSNTTVEGTTVIFVGEATDMGGDGTIDAWFEYGQSTNYSQKTLEKTLTQEGRYCITVSNLNPCATYHYRAAVRNILYTSYGEDKTFTTTCGPTVAIKANGFDGPITIPYGNLVTLSWNSTNANSCSASGAWSGSKTISGSETTGSIASSKTYTLSCTGPAGSVSDSVTVNVDSPSLSVSLNSSLSSGCAPLNDVDLTASVSGAGSGDITYFFDCANDGSWEKIITSSSNSYTAYNICNYGLTGNYTAKVKVERQGISAENTSNINVYSCYSSPVVDIKANGSAGSVTIPYNTSANLAWSSTDANSCYASGNWSGSKSTSGSENTGDLTSSRSYTLTCSGTGGSNSDSVTVNVGSAPMPAAISVSKLVKNVSKGQSSWYKSVYANPSENLSFNILVTSIGNTKTDNIFVKDILPPKIVYNGNLKVDGVLFGGNIVSGINIGSLEPGKLKVITFDATIASKDNFGYGQTNLENRVEVTAGNILKTDIASVYVNKTAVAGDATEISTGIASTLFSSLLPPFLIALAMIFLFQTHFFKMESWIEGRMKEKRGYAAEKQLEKYRKSYTEKH